MDERTGLCLAVLARNSNLVQILLGAKVRIPSLCVSMDGKGWEAGGGKLQFIDLGFYGKIGRGFCTQTHFQLLRGLILGYVGEKTRILDKSSIPGYREIPGIPLEI